MKLYPITLLLLLSLCLNGCIDKEYDDCPGNNSLNIRFLYKGDGDSDIFSSKIKKVDLFIFDKEGLFVQTQCLTQTDLEAYQGVSLNLPQGDYRFVCWANVCQNSQFTASGDLRAITDLNLQNSASQSIITTCDSLYYAYSHTQPVTYVSIGQNLGQTHIIEFKSAHIKINVYLSGLTDPEPAQVEITSMTPGYDVYMKPIGTEVLYTQSTTGTTFRGRQMDWAQFYVPRIKNDNSIKINIRKASTGELLCQIDFRQFLSDNAIDVSAFEEIVIPVHVQFTGTHTAVTLPDWEEEPVQPEI